jgi:S-adenosylmethionine-dependent methyltransferase
MLMYEQYFLKSRQGLQRLEGALLASYFSKHDPDFLTSEAGREDIRANVHKRYENALEHVVPWVAAQGSLQGKKLVEIGCGTGSSTAAFAHFVEKIVGYDINTDAIAAARVRLEVLELDNVELHLVTAENLVATLEKNHPEQVDIILLFAVLEHQTIPERHETLSLCWSLLADDGLLVVSETPNLLHYTDLHTSLLPFLHLLPSELYARYADQSQRQDFSTDFSAWETLSASELDTRIMRWGRGVSFHDFELALGMDHGRFIVANGFEEEILSWFEVSLEEELLRYYFMEKELSVPLAFSRVVLNIIYKKGNPAAGSGAAVPKNKFIADMYTVSEQEIYINTLRTALITAETRLLERDACPVQSSFSAGVVQKCKAFFSHFTR